MKCNKLINTNNVIRNGSILYTVICASCIHNHICHISDKICASACINATSISFFPCMRTFSISHIHMSNILCKRSSYCEKSLSLVSDLNQAPCPVSVEAAVVVVVLCGDEEEEVRRSGAGWSDVIKVLA